MQDLRELYQETILDHNKNPRHFHKMEDATRVVDGRNPLCGDHYTIYVQLEGEVIRDISFEGAGCAISKASGSLMSSILKGKKVEEAIALFHLFHRVVTGEIRAEAHLEKLGKLAAFAGVAEYPVRVKCATLPWHAVISALKGDSAAVSTEEDNR